MMVIFEVYTRPFYQPFPQVWIDEKRKKLEDKVI